MCITVELICMHLFCLSARRDYVTAAEMDEFNKQAECLNLPPPVFLDSEKGMNFDASNLAPRIETHVIFQQYVPWGSCSSFTNYLLEFVTDVVAARKYLSFKWIFATREMLKSRLTQESSSMDLTEKRLLRLF